MEVHGVCEPLPQDAHIASVVPLVVRHCPFEPRPFETLSGPDIVRALVEASPVTFKFVDVAPVNTAFVANRFVEVADVEVEFKAVKFWRVVEPVTKRSLLRVERPASPLIVEVAVLPT